MNNTDRLYNHYQKLDMEGWNELQVVKKYIKGDIYSHFNYEDNIGLFENINGKELINWYEKMEFSRITDSKFIGMYEKCTYSNPTENKEYKDYKDKVKKEFIKAMSNKYDSLEL